MEWKPVLTKKDFVRRYQEGEFGDASLSWNTLEEFIEGSSSRNKYHLRNRVVGGPTYYNLTRKEIIHEWIFTDDEPSWYTSEMAPHQYGLMNGEVQRTPYGLSLYYAPGTRPMREALRESGRQVWGLTAVMLLRSVMPPSDWEWLNTLLDRYDGHVVEFTTFSCRWGTLDGFTVWWEVRSY